MSPAAVETPTRSELTAALKEEAARLGFDPVGIAPAVKPDGFHQLHHWLQHGYAGQMVYLEKREEAYEHPRHILAEVRSIIMLGLNYHTAAPPEEQPPAARVSRYAWGERDYHEVLRDKLRQLAAVLHKQRPACRTRGVVDTAPLLERDFARLAGLGWFGKNTMLINKRKGSWLFLAALLTDVRLDYDEPHTASHCGSCTACLEACPTDAFPEPYVLDARRCISYLTIEHRGPIAPELRDGMGDWLFGCDVCQEVCPWNRKAPPGSEADFQPAGDLSPADAVALLQMDEAAFRARFRRTALWRPGRSGLLRNAALVLGNLRQKKAVPALCAALHDEDAVIRGAAAWALGKIGGTQAAAALRDRLKCEPSADVREEIEAARQRLSSTDETEEDKVGE